MIRLLVLLLTAMPAAAQFHVGIGAGAGMQSYENVDDDPRVLSEVELLVRRGRWGAHIAVEYADLSSAGRIFVTHLDAAYRWPLARQFSILAGTGPTIVSSETGQSIVAWNAEVELARRFGRMDVFARIRQYDYSLLTFRDRASPEGPAVHVGARFALRQ